MINGKKQKLISLIADDLDILGIVSLIELYELEQRLLGQSAVKDLKYCASSDIITGFINCCQLNSAGSTVYNYGRLLGNFLAFTKNNLNSDTLSNYIKSKQWGDATLRRNLIVLRRFLYYIFENKYILIDLSRNIKIPVKVKKISFCPTEAQVSKFLSEIKNIFKGRDEIIKYETIFKLYIKTGFRRNELIGLNIEDIDFTSNTITVIKTKNRDVKVINMDQDIENILLDYIMHFKYASGPIFRGLKGSRISRQAITTTFHKIRDIAGLPGQFKIHSFRRYFINTLRKNNIDLVTIQRLAGHRDIRTTETYCNVSDEEKVRALEKVKV